MEQSCSESDGSGIGGSKKNQTVAWEGFEIFQGQIDDFDNFQGHRRDSLMFLRCHLGDAMLSWCWGTLGIDST
jgi:hypothetical protein